MARQGPSERLSRLRSRLAAGTMDYRPTYGSKLSAAEDQNLMAFEADEYDKQTRSGWSVLVNGRAQAVCEEAEIQRLNHLGLHPWATAVDRPFWIRIRPTSISGRQTPG